MKKNIFVVQSYAEIDSFCSSRLPQSGETLIACEHMRCTGGKGLNQAQAARFFGANVEVIGRVGNDPAGIHNKQICEEQGIGSRFLVLDDMVPTGKCAVFRSSSGENAILVYPGAADNFSVQDFAAADSYVSNCVIGGFQLEINPDAVFASIIHCDEMGVMAFLDPSPVPEKIDDAVYSHLSYLKLNEHEASLLSGVRVEGVESALEAGKVFLSKGIKRSAIITLGGNGCVCVERRCACYFPAPKVPIRDSSAAGDCFAGAFLAAMADGLSCREAISRASCFAALKVANVVGSLCDLYDEECRAQYKTISEDYKTQMVPQMRTWHYEK